LAYWLMRTNNMNKKISDTKIEIETITPERVEKIVYDKSFIEQQIKQITAQRDEMIALKEAEQKKCQDILKEMGKVGMVVEEPIEEKLDDTDTSIKNIL
jgi:predicted lactoylglutathione lyase